MLFLALGLISLVLFYQNYFFRMKRNEAEQLLKVSLDSEKNERQRIAADLHDSVAGDLSAIKNYLSLLQRSNVAVKDEPVFAEIKTGVENALENTRLISYKLMPPLLETFGLAAAVKDHMERITAKTTINFTIDAAETLVISASISYELFRIIQEFTTNMIKYGNISECIITMKHTNGVFEIDIKDDGIPFDFFKSVKMSKGLGLQNISSRLKVIGADLLQKEQTKGNHFTITLKAND